MSIVVGEVIAVSGIRISLRIFEDSSQETIFYEGVKYRGVSLREHISIQRGFIVSARRTHIDRTHRPWLMLFSWWRAASDAAAVGQCHEPCA